MAEFSRVVAPRSRQQIEVIAGEVRELFGLRPHDYVPVAQLIENVLPEMLPEYDYRIVENGQLGRAEAITDAHRPVITFTRKTYNGVYRNWARPRMTAIHEVGHLLLHTGQHAFAFVERYDPLIDPERQADAFAAAFLMPEVAFREVKSIDEAMHRFGVTRDAATCRARKLRMLWLVRGSPPPRHAKKKGRSLRRAP